MTIIQIVFLRSCSQTENKRPHCIPPPWLLQRSLRCQSLSNKVQIQKKDICVIKVVVIFFCFLLNASGERRFNTTSKRECREIFYSNKTRHLDSKGPLACCCYAREPAPLLQTPRSSSAVCGFDLTWRHENRNKVCNNEDTHDSAHPVKTLNTSHRHRYYLTLYLKCKK